MLGYGLKYIWNIINVLQFTIYMLHWQIELPVLALFCIEKLKMLVLFEFIPAESIMGWIKEKAGIHNSNNEAKKIDDEQSPVEQDILADGSIILLGIFTLFAIFLITVAIKMKCLIEKNYSVYRFYMIARRKIFHNTIIRYFYTSAIKLQMIACNIFFAGFTLTLSTSLQWFTAVMIYVAIYGIYFKFFFYMRSNRDDLDTPSMRAKIGSLY